MVVVRDGFDESVATILLDTFLHAQPAWEAVYGGYKPFYLADMRSWFHDLDQLPPGM